jgi:hypothetical protein
MNPKTSLFTLLLQSELLPRILSHVICAQWQLVGLTLKVVMKNDSNLMKVTYLLLHCTGFVIHYSSAGKMAVP